MPPPPVASSRPAGRGEPVPPPDALIKDEPHTLIWSEALDDGGRAIVKMYRRRDPFSYWRERRFGFRVQREYEALAHLVRSEVPCSEPLWWDHGRSPTHGRYEVLATRKVEGGTPVRGLVAAGQADRLQWELAPLYALIRRMHECGLYHGVLHLNNVLVRPAAGFARDYFIIDTPRSILFPRSIVGTPMAWFDVQYASDNAVRYLALEAETLPLADYGMDETTRQRFLRELPGFSRSKVRRKGVRGRAWIHFALSRRNRSAGESAAG